jgi:mono/diheme cytochrome c family protein
MRKVFKAAVFLLTVASALAGTALLLTWRRGLSARTAPGRTETQAARAVREWFLPARYRRLRNPVACSDETLAQARAHWADHCAGCHANNGSGDSALGRTMYPRPPDMRQAATQTQSDGALYYTIDNGVPLTGMPAFGEAGDGDRDTWKLVCFVRHLPRLSAEEEWSMRKLNPRTPDELAEELEEERFLNGGTPEPAPARSQPHVHK